MTWRTLPFLAASVLLIPLAACTDKNEASGTGTGGGGTVKVTSTDDECLLSTDEISRGTVVFEVTNKGTKITELHFESEGGKTIVGEVENIGPGITRELTVQAAPGTFEVACKPGMIGDGNRAKFTVTDS